MGVMYCNYNHYTINKLVITLSTGIYETVNTNSSDGTGQRNVAVSDNSTTEACDLEMQICRAYEVEEGTVLMEPNIAYSAPTNNIEMQSCDAYEVEKKSVRMESNVAYVAHC